MWPPQLSSDQNSREDRRKQAVGGPRMRKSHQFHYLIVIHAFMMLLRICRILLRNMFYTHLFSCSRHPWTMNVFFLRLQDFQFLLFSDPSRQLSDFHHFFIFTFWFTVIFSSSFSQLFLFLQFFQFLKFRRGKMEIRSLTYNPQRYIFAWSWAMTAYRPFKEGTTLSDNDPLSHT